MKSPRRPAPRDPTQTTAYYKKIVSTKIKAIERAIKKHHEGLLPTLPGKCISVGLALYSAGHPVAECLHWFDEAVSHELRSLEMDGYRLVGYTTIEQDLELFPAGALVDRAGELVDAYRRFTFQKPSPPRVEGLMDQLCSVLTSKPVKVQSSTLQDLKKNAKEWLVLPPLFRAVGQRDAKAFEKTLADFLTLYWRKEIRGASVSSEYVGKWSLMAAALCKKMGRIPNLPEKAMQYIPVELVGLPKSVE